MHLLCPVLQAAFMVSRLARAHPSRSQRCAATAVLPTPQFKLFGGSARENIALQNIQVRAVRCVPCSDECAFAGAIAHGVRVPTRAAAAMVSRPAVDTAGARVSAAREPCRLIAYTGRRTLTKRCVGI
jgi:hypothetical protein